MTSDAQPDATRVSAPRVMPAPAPLIATPLVALILIAAIGGYSLDWGWTGFKDNGTVWDWLHLMILPLVVVLAPFWLRSDAAERRWWKVFAAAVVAAFIVLITGGYGYGWGWTGFEGNNLWDWFSLLLVPVAVPLAMATVTIRLERMESDRSDNRDGDADRTGDPNVDSASEPAAASGDIGS